MRYVAVGMKDAEGRDYDVVARTYKDATELLVSLLLMNGVIEIADTRQEPYWDIIGPNEKRD